MEILEKVEQLKAELDSLRPLDAQAEARIWQKFRLDWNYHSNKLEGNTYSFGETKMLLLKGLTAGGKPIRDHEEISGHDAAINFILDSIRNGEPLSEVFIRHLHKLILVRPFWADAKTSTGKPTKRLVKVGQYKTEPNHVETLTGEIFYFAEPIETPAKMQELVEWFRSKTESPETNQILLAAEFHYRFVRIHPFDDGNGRLARLLMNYILMKDGFPPVIIRNEDKDTYIAVLEQADFAILLPFVEFVVENLARSLEIMIKGARGENIEEVDDVNKEIAMLEKRIRAFGHRVEVKRSKKTIRSILQTSIHPLMQKYFHESRNFNPFYLFVQENLLVDGQMARVYESAARFGLVQAEGDPEICEIKIAYLGIGLTQDAFGDFQHESSLLVFFDLTKYRVAVSGNQWNLEKSYSEHLSPEEMERLVNAEKKFHLEAINKEIGNLNG